MNQSAATWSKWMVCWVSNWNWCSKVWRIGIGIYKSPSCSNYLTPIKLLLCRLKQHSSSLLLKSQSKSHILSWESRFKLDSRGMFRKRKWFKKKLTLIKSLLLVFYKNKRVKGTLKPCSSIIKNRFSWEYQHTVSKLKRTWCSFKIQLWKFKN